MIKHNNEIKWYLFSKALCVTCHECCHLSAHKLVLESLSSFTENSSESFLFSSSCTCITHSLPVKLWNNQFGPISIRLSRTDQHVVCAASPGSLWKLLAHWYWQRRCTGELQSVDDLLPGSAGLLLSLIITFHAGSSQWFMNTAANESSQQEGCFICSEYYHR